MNTRIKRLRKTLKLNQTDFGNCIGVTQSAVTAYECGSRKPLDAVINSICKEFNVNEVWLRTGEGEMFIEMSSDDRYSISLGKLSKSENEFIQNAINYLANAEPEKLKAIEEFMKTCLGIK